MYTSTALEYFGLSPLIASVDEQNIYSNASLGGSQPTQSPGGTQTHLVSFSWSKLLLLLLIVTNLKHIPLVYHLRILNAVRFVLRSQRPVVDIQPHQLFQPLITSSRATLLDIDVYGHKSNSTYFIDVDIARAHLITTVFGKGIEKHRGSTTMNGLSGKATSKFSLALGGVSCTFRKELLPYEKYDVWSRVLSWDNKWLYIVSHFVKRGTNIEPKEYALYPQQKSYASKVKSSNEEISAPVPSPIVASALSKVVFKDGRKTIPPEDMLVKAELLPSDTTLQRTIEEERVRGMCSADLLAKQTSLEEEFHDEVALGRHHDGLGIEGVVATFAQLGGISNYQLL